jgi:glycosyltransferase involved in cell wall biosynthesis
MAHIAIDARIVNSTSGRYVERLLTYLQDVDTNNRYTILVPEKDRDYWKPTAKNFTVMVADFDNYSFEEQLGFNHFLTDLAPDLVHFCMPQQPLPYRGKTITTFHDMTLVRTYNSDKNWLLFHAKQLVGKQVFKKVARKADHIIAITEYTKKDLLDFVTVPEEKISVIYEAGETTSGESTPYSVPYKQFLLYVGNHSDYKNIKRLTDAHQQLLKTYPKLGLVLAGKLNAAALKTQSYVTDKKYKNIHFTDFVTDEELNWLYDNAATYVFPSLMEGFGLPGLEAMGHNLPVVSSNATCLPEVYGDAAIYFDPLNVEDMAEKISLVLDSKDMQMQLAAEGQKQLKKYSWKKMAKETHAVYMKVLHERG